MMREAEGVEWKARAVPAGRATERASELPKRLSMLASAGPGGDGGGRRKTRYEVARWLPRWPLAGLLVGW